MARETTGDGETRKTQRPPEGRRPLMHNADRGPDKSAYTHAPKEGPAQGDLPDALPDL